VLDLLGAADEALVVTSPEPTALADAYGLIKSLSRRMHPGTGAAISLVVNEAADAREALGVHARAAAVCHRFLMLPLPLAGWVPADPLVSRAVRARTPLIRYASRSPASGAVVKLAQRLRDELGLVPERQVHRGGPGLVARLLRAFGSSSAAATSGAAR
jgi:flagellar biosynthesis protein FlhG